jgi:hypothetical protein
MMGAMVWAPHSRNRSALVAAQGGKHPAFAGPPRRKAWQRPKVTQSRFMLVQYSGAF